MTTTNTYGRQVVVPLTNKSGGSVIAGDVVIVDTSNNDAFTTSTAGAVTGTVGVAQETIASNATGRVLTAGYAALVNTSASVTRGNYGKTHTVVKQAVDAGSSRVAGTFCQFLTGGTTPDAIVFPADLGSGSGTGTLTTVKDEGSNLSTAVVSVDFVGAGVTATGTTAVTVTIPGGGSGNRYVFVLGTSTPKATSGSWTDSIDTAYQFGSYKASPGAQNNSIDWELLLEAGTYTLDLFHLQGTNRGIYTVKIDGSSTGTTIDGYNGGGTTQAHSTSTGIVVGTTGIRTLQLIMATKNASSSSYFGLINGLSLVRTGA